MGLMGVVREYADRVRRTTCSAVQLLSLGRFPSVYVIYKTRKTAWKEENLPISITGNTVFSYFLFFYGVNIHVSMGQHKFILL